MSDECSRCYGRGYYSDGFGRMGCPRCYGTGKADAKHPQVVFAEERDARIRREALATVRALLERPDSWQTRVENALAFIVLAAEDEP